VVSREHRNTRDNPDVLLVTLPPRRLKTMSIGLKFLASRLNAYHTRVEMLDLNLSVFNRVVDSQKTLWRPKNQNEWQYKESFKRLIEKQGMRESINFCIKSLLSSNTPVLLFSINRVNLRFAVEVVTRLKKFNPDLIIVFGGHEGALESGRQIAQSNCVDFFIGRKDVDSLCEIIKATKPITN